MRQLWVAAMGRQCIRGTCLGTDGHVYFNRKLEFSLGTTALDWGGHVVFPSSIYLDLDTNTVHNLNQNCLKFMVTLGGMKPWITKRN
jgi:hypothetical protein